MSDREKTSEALERIATLAESVAVPLGLSVVAVKFGQAGKRRTLELTIHRAGGSVSLDDCQAVSRGLEQLLDDAQTKGAPLVAGAYMLEVQSPGMDRELKTDREFRVFVGRRVQVQTRQPVEDLGDTFIGTLGGVNDNVLTVTNAKPQQQKKKETPIVREEVTVDLSKCTHVRLYSELLEKSSDRKAETHN